MKERKQQNGVNNQEACEFPFGGPAVDPALRAKYGGPPAGPGRVGRPATLLVGHG